MKISAALNNGSGPESCPSIKIKDIDGAKSLHDERSAGMIFDITAVPYIKSTMFLSGQRCATTSRTLKVEAW